MWYHLKFDLTLFRLLRGGGAFLPLLMPVVLLLSLATSFSAAQPTLTLEPAAVLLDGATPGGQVAWLSVSRRPMETHQRVEILRQLTPVDAAGRAVLEPAEPVTLKSLWVAVDLETGEWVTAAAEVSVLREEALRPKAFVGDGSGARTRLLQERRQLEVLVVLPRSEAGPAAAWAGRVEDGGALDAGTAWDGQVALRIEALPPLPDGGEAAAAFEAGDVVVVIDPERMTVRSTRLGEEDGRGGEA